MTEDWPRWLAAVMFASLRFAPLLVFAPPFTLLRVPPLIRVLIAIVLAASAVSGRPITGDFANITAAGMVVQAIGELALGAWIALLFQIVFAALALVGRTIDMQVGFGLALLIDPTSKAQMPLVGTFFALVAGLVFFITGGHFEIYAIVASSLETVPPGTWTASAGAGSVMRILGNSFAVAMAAGGAVILVLLVVDLLIGVLSRTVPQMNALLLGFQVKVLVLFAVLPVAFGAGSSWFLRLVRLALSEAGSIA